MALAIVFRPKANGQFGSFIFHYAINRPTLTPARKGEAAPVNQPPIPIEADMLILNPGVNFVEADRWKMVSEHGGNGKVIADMQAKGALSVYAPDVESPVGATSDFTNLAVVEDILRNTNDEEWISRSTARDSREAVFKMGSARIQTIREMKSFKGNDSGVLEMV